jgi:hypothetical protein
VPCAQTVELPALVQSAEAGEATVTPTGISATARPNIK